MRHFLSAKLEETTFSSFTLPRKAKEDSVIFSAYLCQLLVQPLIENKNYVRKPETQDVKSGSPQHLKPKHVSMQTKQHLYDYVNEVMDAQGN